MEELGTDRYLDGERAVKHRHSTTMALSGVALLATALFISHERFSGRSAAQPSAAQRSPSQPPTVGNVESVGSPAAIEAKPCNAPPEPHTEHSHPITGEHIRMQRARSLLAELNQAMHLRDVTAFDATLATYRLEFPEDSERLQTAYALIGACLRAPTTANRLAAEEFYRAHRGSTLRRWLRRLCFSQ